MRFLKAFAWLRWRLLINTIRGSRRRDRLEGLSRITNVAIKAALLLIPIGGGLLLLVLGLLGGYAVGSGSIEPGWVLVAARITLLVVLLLLVLVPLSVASRSGITGYQRLQLLPIPRSSLHLVEVLASLADPWVGFVLPGVFAFGLGLLLGGHISAAVVGLAAALGITIVLASLGALIGFLMTWLMRNRRRGEMFTLIFVIVISVFSLVPLLLSDGLERNPRQPKPSGGAPERHTVERLDQSLPRWSIAIPSELYGFALRSSIEGRAGIGWLSTGGLFLQAAALYVLSAAMHRKLIESPEGGSQPRRVLRLISPGLQLPGLSAAASAVAIAQARTALRSVRGRVIVFLPGPTLALLVLVSKRVPQAFPGGSTLGSAGHLMLGVSIIFALYALQAFTMNQFASDRAGLTLQFLAPISDSDLVKGKTAGCGILFSATVLVCLLCALLVSGGGSPLVWLSVLMGGAATYLLLSPMASLLSALFPVASDLSKTGTGGNPHGIAMLVGTLLVMVASGPAALIVVLGFHYYHRSDITFLLMAVWTIIAALISIPLLGPASRMMAARRENIALVAQGR